MAQYVFGLDIGIASVGWAVLDEQRIVDLGVRCFDPGENNDGEPHNQKRRGARAARNRLHMRRWRLHRLLQLFCDTGIIERADPQLLATPPRAKDQPETGPWQLRAKGLNEQLEPLEWARVLYHMVKHRGFEFFRKSDAKAPLGAATDKTEPGEHLPVETTANEVTTDKDKQKLNKALEDSSKLLSHYRDLLGNPDLTIAGLLIWLAQDSYAPGEARPEEEHRIRTNTFRNKHGDYRHAFRRAVLRQELRELFTVQIKYQNPHTTSALPDDGQYLRQMVATYGKTGIPIGGESRAVGRTFQEAVFDLFDLQHPPLYAEQIREMVGECELIEGQPRASKNAFSAERATWLEKLNHLKIRRSGKEDFLTEQERACLMTLPYERRVVTLKLVRETLMAQTGFPASWKEANFNVARYQSKPANDGAWIFVTSHGKEPLSLAKWADNKERKVKLQKVREMLTGGVVTFQQLRQLLGLSDSDRFTYKLKATSIIAREQEAAEHIPFAREGDGILAGGQSFRCIPADGKPKVLPKIAWKLVASLRSHSAATLADWRAALLSSSLNEMPHTWQFEHSIQTETTVELEAEAHTQVPLQFEDAQAVEIDHKLVELKGWHNLRLALTEQAPERWARFQLAYQEPLSIVGRRAAQSMDDIATTLTVCQTDQEIELKLSELGYTQAEIEALQSISFNKFRNLSFAALEKILPHLEKGHVYSKACELAELSHSEKTVEKRTLRLPPLETYLYKRRRHGNLTGYEEKRYKELRNPVVARSFNQARLVFNALVIKHGSPAHVHVETARDLARSKKLREKISNEQNTNRKRIDGLRADLRNWLGHEPSTAQILKMRFYSEQDGKCIYTGKTLNRDQILRDEEYVEIDHIWPRSMTFDNSLDNRVLVAAGANRDKSNKIPYEFLGGANGNDEWRAFETRVLACKGMSAEKQRRLLSKSLEDADEFLARNLVDTRFVTRMFANMLRERVEFAGGAKPEELEAISPDDGGTIRWNRYQRARVRTPQGRLVDFLRGKWGLAHAKDRETSDLHHALDACIIAACTPKVIERVNRFFAEEEKEPGRHSFKRNADGTYTHRGTGEVLSRNDARERGLYLPAPWDDVVEGKFRRDLLSALDTVFISRRPKRKSAGELHDANPKGIRYLPVPLVDLTEDMLANGRLREITGRRRENYEALRRALRDAGDNAKIAFSDGHKIRGTNDKPKLVHHIALPLWSLPEDYLKQRRKLVADKNRSIRKKNESLVQSGGSPIPEINDHVSSGSAGPLISTRKTVLLTDLKKEVLTENYLGVTFYKRNKELLEALKEHLGDKKAKDAFAQAFQPPPGKSGKQRPVIRSIRLPDAHGSGMLVRGGIVGLGDSVATEVYWIEGTGYFFRPRYQVDKEVTFGLDDPPANARHIFNLRIDEPIKVVMNDGSEVPGIRPGYFVGYEGDGRMTIRVHDRPGKGRQKTKKADDSVADDQAIEQQARIARGKESTKDHTLFRFSVSGIKKLVKFKVDALGNYKEIAQHLQHGLA